MSIQTAAVVKAHIEKLIKVLRELGLTDDDIEECVQVSLGKRQWDTDVGR